MLISLLALLLLLLDMCRSSCETSFPRFVFIQTCPNHLLALAALPESFCVPSVALPCTGENLQHVFKSWKCSPSSSAAKRAARAWGLGPFSL